MRILLVSPLPPPAGGIATWTKFYVEYCATYGIDCEVVNTALLGKRANKTKNKRIIIDEIIRTIKIIKDLKRKIKGFKPSIVHLNTSCSKFGLIRDYLCVKIIKKNKISLVLHCRCNIEDQLGGRKSSIKYFKKISNLADKILTLNTPSFSYANSVVNGKALTFPNFIKENNAPKIEKVNETLSKVIFVGHVKRSKGIFELLETAKANGDIAFDVYGPIDSEVSKNTIPTNVKLYGMAEHDVVLEKLHGYDLFLFPTYTEGFSNALAEAMYAGLPVIATDVGANKDMIESSGGIIVPTKNVQEIINAVEVMKDSNFRQNCSNFNKNKVNENYIIDKVMKSLFEIYRGVIGSDI